MTNKITKYEKRMKKYQKKLNFDDPNFQFENPISAKLNDRYLKKIEFLQRELVPGETLRERANSIMQNYGPYKPTDKGCIDLNGIPIPRPKDFAWQQENCPRHFMNHTLIPCPLKRRLGGQMFCNQENCKKIKGSDHYIEAVNYTCPKNRGYDTIKYNNGTLDKTTWKVGDTGWKKALELAIANQKTLRINPADDQRPDFWWLT